MQWMNYCRRIAGAWLLAGTLSPVFSAAGANAVDVNVVGLMKGKATLIVNGGAPRTLLVGQSTAEGVKLIAADSLVATVEVGGQRQSITVGERAAIVATGIVAGPRSVTLYPDSRGHFMTIGSVNAIPVRFLVDSGATKVILPAAEAKRLGIDYSRAERGLTMTANGPVGVFHLVLRSVKIGELELKDVAAEINEAPMAEALLGMSFISRVSMRRDGPQLTLSQKDDARPVVSGATGGHATATLKSARGGHFIAEGSINGGAINMLVDTGASLVSISMADARRMGINYLRGERGWTMTANGRAPVYYLKFNEVKVGDILLRNIDGAVLEGDGLPIALLGMSFLNRTDIRRDGNVMTLTQRF